MKETFANQNFDSSQQNRLSSASDVPSSSGKLKRKHSEVVDDTFTASIRREVYQKKADDARNLQAKLANISDSGRAWFDVFDTDKSSSLEKRELITAMHQ